MASCAAQDVAFLHIRLSSLVCPAFRPLPRSDRSFFLLMLTVAILLVLISLCGAALFRTGAWRNGARWRKGRYSRFRRSLPRKRDFDHLSRLHTAHDQALATFLERQSAPPAIKTRAEWEQPVAASSRAAGLCRQIEQLDVEDLRFAVFELWQLEAQQLSALHPFSLALGAVVDSLALELRLASNSTSCSSSLRNLSTLLGHTLTHLRKILHRLFSSLFSQPSSSLIPSATLLPSLIRLYRLGGPGPTRPLYPPSFPHRTHNVVLSFVTALRELVRLAGVVRPDEPVYAEETVAAWWVERDWKEVVRTERVLHREILEAVLGWKEDKERKSLG
ncbi:hypothetical protein JCM8547_008448 [Rhodosporidiobolus lusitaniae]